MCHQIIKEPFAFDLPVVVVVKSTNVVNNIKFIHVTLLLLATENFGQNRKFVAALIRNVVCCIYYAYILDVKKKKEKEKCVVYKVIALFNIIRAVKYKQCAIATGSSRSLKIGPHLTLPKRSQNHILFKSATPTYT